MASLKARIRMFPAATALALVSVLFFRAHAETSPLSVLPEGFGMEVSPYSSRERAMGDAGMASLTKQGLSIPNPSRSAFHDKTSFTASIETDVDFLHDAKSANRTSSFVIPSMGMNFQTRRFGTVGLSYYERFHRNFQYTGLVALDTTESYNAEGALYEVAAGWAYAPIPVLAFGIGYHYLLGESRWIRSKHFNNPSDPLLKDAQNLQGDTLSTRGHGGFPSISATFRQKKFSLAMTAALGVTLDQKSGRSVTHLLSDVDSVSNQKLPWSTTFGAAYKPLPNQTLVVDVAYEAWEKQPNSPLNPAYKVGLGYEYQGLGGPYDAYYRKIAYRGGLGYEKVYLEQVDNYFFTAGAGVPLGRRGNTLDLALKYGHRGPMKAGMFEDYFRLSLSLTGVGIWGQPVRKKK